MAVVVEITGQSTEPIDKVSFNGSVSGKVWTVGPITNSYTNELLLSFGGSEYGDYAMFSGSGWSLIATEDDTVVGQVCLAQYQLAISEGSYSASITNATAQVGGMYILSITGISSGTPVYNSGISRLSDGSLAIGNGNEWDFSGALSLTTLNIKATVTAPTSAVTAGTVGQIIAHDTLLYFCSVTGVAGSATWNIINLTAV
jgi:hypothetical protein